MIQEAYVSFEIAKLLKEKGFDGKCFDFYEVEYEKPIKKHAQKPFPTDWNDEDDENCYSAPTQAMACAWLREEHNIFITVYCGRNVYDDDPYYWATLRGANVCWRL